jgi:ABC-type bacteriocin/lantibiotic exporter with double-glycine peptidase domain
MSYFSCLKNSLSLQLPEDRVSPERNYATLRDSLRHLYPAVLKNWRTGAVAYGLLIVTSLLTYPQPMITRYLIDDVILNKQIKMLPPVLLLLLGIAAVSATASLFQSFYSTRFNQEVTLQIQQNLISRVLSLPKTFFDHMRKGYLMSRLTSDVNGVSWFFSGTAVEIVMQCFRFIGGLGFLFYLEWRLAIPVVLSLPAPFLATVFFARRNYVIGHLNRERNARYYSVCHEMFSTIPLIKTFCREKKAEREIVAEIRNNNRAANEQAVLHSFHHHVMTAMPNAARFLVLALGSYWVIRGEWTVGSLLAFLAYLSFVYGPVNYLAIGANQLQSTRAALERVAALLNAIPEDNAESGLAVKSLNGEVEFKNVSFAYDPQRPVLTGVSFHAAPGEHWAVLGKSGAGKTTLASLIMRFYRPGSGEIYFDGKKASEYNVRALRARIGFVAQHTELLSGSILDNLKMGNDDASFAEVERACQIADIDRHIKSLPEQYRTLLEEEGVNLSEGQKQRLSIARALVKSPDILIMDEPTSTLDNGTERSIYAMLPDAVKGKTFFTIAHRLNTVKSADRVLFLREGEPPRCGTHDELMKQDEYKTFFDNFETGTTFNHLKSNEA